MSDAFPSARALATAVRAGEISALEVAEQSLSRIAAGDSAIRAFTTLTAERARREARAVDAVIAAGRDPGPLAGVPFAVKNLFDLEGEITLAGSRINRDDPPAARDATAVARLRGAGAVCLGGLNMGEYAYDFTTENTHYGATHNPHDLQRSAGGSSGGSAAAVAAGFIPLSLGTDTNGSIRVPASFCGIWGLKPTYGRLSRTGGFLFVESLDHIGPFARSVQDLATAYDILQGPDPDDPACAQRAIEPATPALDAPWGDLRIGVLGGYFAPAGLAEPAAAVRAVAECLAASTTLELPMPAIARAAAYTLTATEGGSRHRERLIARANDFDPQTRDRFIAGLLTPSAWYLQAQKFRAIWRDRIRELFRKVDILLAPATPFPATELGQQTMTLGDATMAVRPNLGLFTQPISFIGLPVIAAPVHLPGSLPVGVQLIAAPWNEAALFRVAARLERAGVCTAPVARAAASSLRT